MDFLDAKRWEVKRFVKYYELGHREGEDDFDYRMILLNVPIGDLVHFYLLWTNGNHKIETPKHSFWHLTSRLS